ncbi:cbb3-type cytochrome oxidase assembly protein CcoS [Bosea sp. NPDC055594]
MNILIVLMPLALALGLTGLAAFFWSMRTGQYSDMEGPGWRILDDDDLATESVAAETAADQRVAAPRQRS